ncbi:MAG: LysR family transcriptional regulator, partial [Oscillospiraceae bacterium]
MAINVDKSDRSPFGMKLTIRLFSDQWDKSFGPGLAELLEQVDGCGSLRVATATMEISYSKAWCLLGDCERALGFLLLDRTVGGQHGGSSHLTPQG